MSKINSIKSDQLGIAASLICMIHCTILPMFMLVQNFAHLGLELEQSSWFENLDYFFIAFSGLAILFSTYFAKNHKYTFVFVVAWLLQITGVALEKRDIPYGVLFITLSSILLIITHLKNLKWHPH